jgi:hypothetical protein
MACEKPEKLRKFLYGVVTDGKIHVFTFPTFNIKEELTCLSDG